MLHVRNTIELTCKIDETRHVLVPTFVNDVYFRADMPPRISFTATWRGNNFMGDPMRRLTVRRVPFSPWEERGIAKSRRQRAPLCPIHQHRAGIPVDVRRVYVATAVHLHSATSKPNCESPGLFARHVATACLNTYVKFFRSMVKYMIELSSFCSALRFETFCNKHPSRWLCTYGLIASMSVRPKLNPNCKWKKRIMNDTETNSCQFTIVCFIFAKKIKDSFIRF